MSFVTRPRLIVAGIVLAVTGMIGVPAAMASATPSFEAPFPCGFRQGAGTSSSAHRTPWELDFWSQTGDPIHAAAAGTVRTASMQYSNGFGKLVVIEHTGGWTSYYAHLNTISVRPGQKVTQGQRIGTAGATTAKHRGMGPHLHFEVRQGSGYPGNIRPVVFHGKRFPYPRGYVTSQNCPTATKKPTKKPTTKPTTKPSTKPTQKPSPTQKPIGKPTNPPIGKLTQTPAPKPIGKPTNAPIGKITQPPATKPSTKPTVRLSARPVPRTSMVPTPTATPTPVKATPAPAQPSTRVTIDPIELPRVPLPTPSRPGLTEPTMRVTIDPIERGRPGLPKATTTPVTTPAATVTPMPTPAPETPAAPADPAPAPVADPTEPDLSLTNPQREEEGPSVDADHTPKGADPVVDQESGRTASGRQLPDEEIIAEPDAVVARDREIRSSGPLAKTGH